jgi:predicted DNA-binding transcriptional regulator YafY
MLGNQTSRLSRLTAILTQLQAKRLITATELADKFKNSIRTIYRDIKALEAPGIPICVVEGKGYSLMEGYRLPPIAFSEA